MPDSEQVITYEDLYDTDGRLLTIAGDIIDVVEKGPDWYRVKIAQAGNRVVRVPAFKVGMLVGGGRCTFYDQV